MILGRSKNQGTDVTRSPVGPFWQAWVQHRRGVARREGREFVRVAPEAEEREHSGHRRSPPLHGFTRGTAFGMGRIRGPGSTSIGRGAKAAGTGRASTFAGGRPSATHSWKCERLYSMIASRYS